MMVPSLHYRTLHRVLLVLLLPCMIHQNAAGQTHTLRLRVIDAETRAALPARVYLNSESGQPFYFQTDSSEGTAVRYEKQNWINKASVEYHTTVTSSVCRTALPAGTYRLRVEHGKEFLPHTQTLVIDGDQEQTVPLRRWCSPQQEHWFSGDTHLHRTPDELKNVIAAEDLNVALPLTNWVTVSGTAPKSGNKNLAVIDDGLIEVDPTHVIWPRNTEYEIFSVGDKRHTLGALFVLGHRDALEVGVPPWKPVVRSVLATDPDALFDMDKLDWPFAMLLPTIAPHALYELSNNHVWQTPFAFREWNTEAPAYLQPPFGASQGGHRQWIDYTLGMYYTLLNCGFRLPPSAGTANGVHPVPAGFGRVYVHLPEGFEFRRWMKALKAGRSFVTTGPMLYATAGGQDPGHVFQLRQQSPLTLRASVASEKPLSYGELLVNGRPEMLLRPSNTPTESGTFKSELQLDVHPKRSGWFALRFWEPRDDGQSRFVHTAPWYVEFDGQPVQPSATEKSYLIKRLEQEIERSQGIVGEAAMNEYQQALAAYRSLPVWDDRDEVAAQARPASGETLQRWLDNMIIDHRFDAEEVRMATGLNREQAQAAIDERSEQASVSGFRVRPYPGGRHPRIGFLDGAVNPQRDTKISVFPPWENGGYVVVDVPEAIFSNLGLTYLAHTHIPTIWDEQSTALPTREWRAGGDTYQMTRRLPNGITFTSRVTAEPEQAAAQMSITLTNGTEEPLTAMRVQICTMLKGAIGFNVQEPLKQVVAPPFVALRSQNADRWIITAWKPNQRVWTNPPVPCFHSDPIFPDCDPGQSVSITGGLWFYEGPDVQQRIDELNASF